ncbi:MAG: hypothetical protein JWR35_592 [Marmoricola sp.]|nr:hypothetical protein [Marmoricola sp.]
MSYSAWMAELQAHLRPPGKILKSLGAGSSLANGRDLGRTRKPTGSDGEYGWEARRAALLAILVLTLPLMGAALAPTRNGPINTAEAVTWLTCNITVLCSAAMLHYCWRISDTRREFGWMVTALTAVSLNGAANVMIQIASEPRSVSPAAEEYSNLAVILPSAGLLMLCASRYRIPRRINPLVLGAAVALVTGTVRFVHLATNVDPVEDINSYAEQIVPVIIALLGVLMCVVLHRISYLPDWAKRGGTFAIGAASLGQLLSIWSDDSLTIRAIALGATVTACIQLCFTASRLLAEAISANAQRMSSLAIRAELAEESIRNDRDIMHELRSTVAGISSATMLLMRHDKRITEVRTAALEEMLESEMARLGRLLNRRTIVSPQTIQLDALLLPMVVAQRIAGHEVRWQSSGLSVLGRPDDLTEVLHILLTNAARHAQGSIVTVSVTPCTHHVEIRVSDSGPGVAGSIAVNLFDRGARSERSPGEGIGLHIAERLMKEQGGSLCLESSSPRSGTTFLITLPSDR